MKSQPVGKVGSRPRDSKRKMQYETQITFENSNESSISRPIKGNGWLDR